MRTFGLSRRIFTATGLLAVLIAATLTVAPAQPATAAPARAVSAAATAPFHWTPADHKGEQAYWATHHASYSGAQLAAWRAAVARMPHASALPPVTRPGPVASMPGYPSGAWQSLGPAPVNVNNGLTYNTGRVQAIAVDPTNANVIYLGAAEGGVWKTTNGGQSWVPLTDTQASLATGDIAIDPNNHNIIYIGTGEPNQSIDSYQGSGILKSTNGGATWTQEGVSAFGTRDDSISRVIVNPRNSNQIFVATSGGLWVSNDGGVTYSITSFGYSYVSYLAIGVNPFYRTVGKVNSWSERWSVASNSAGGRYPRLECRRLVLYTSSMNWPI